MVILSLLIQGTTIPFFARKLGMVLPPKPEPLDSRDIWLDRKLQLTISLSASAPARKRKTATPTP